MREAENIRAVEALGIDLMGFIFWPKSKRYVSERPAYLPTNCKRVGVFVDEDIEVVKKIAHDYALDYIQLHGHESTAYCAQLKGLKLIKAFNIATAKDFEQTKSYEKLVDYFLFDAKGKSVGGNGTKFEWSVLDNYHGPTPFILSGGIGPDDATSIRRFHHPQLAGIDLNSKFEDAPALKNIQKLKTFLEQL
jgi:phosphoribosylanthranilate isomerase